MNEPAYGAHAANSANDARGTKGDTGIGSGSSESVDAVVAAYLDFLEGHGQPPVLDDLSAGDRRQAEILIDAMRAGRGIDPHASTPSIEELLAGTELESALALLSAQQTDWATTSTLDRAPERRGPEAADHRMARAELIETVLRDADLRVAVRIEPHRLVGPAVTASYLDLRAVFYPIEQDEPTITDETRALVSRMFVTDTNLEHVGVVAVGSEGLHTQVLSCSDLGSVLITPSDRGELLWPPVLPLPEALRRMLELSAPIWEPFEFDSGQHEPLDLAEIAAHVAQQVVAREAGRRYRGEKGRAYKSFVGIGPVFADLVVELGTGTTEELNVDEPLDRIAREAA
jgi:hypothetical protein